MDAPQYGWTVPPGYPLPELVDRIPDDQPLVLRHRASRFLAVFGSLYVGLPLSLFLCMYTAFFTMLDQDLDDIGWLGFMPGAIVVAGGLFQLGIMLVAGLSGGPVLAANTDGVWVRARKWPARSVFLPWPAVAHVYARRWLWDRPVCVLAHDTRAGADAGVWARIDMGAQKAMFGSRLTASTFYCGRRADDVLAELHRLSGGRVRIG
ncbi:hypothetical protein GCM10009557_40860 [Virgisporangium ochraceum]|uniref:Uncharacterized protein n=1 Tax=Virgisporangium ochraceum TaxID=65505 RepID=A0A8J3ZZ13_9ACTN|nr:hypothetical protein [Virgisporangium ochraceum]GIJ71100.1 hypothetical protein Voc01_060170 [Virgisporangium ochraceum]